MRSLNRFKWVSHPRERGKTVSGVLSIANISVVRSNALVRFLITAMMRSGTHFLKSVLNGHPGIHSCREVLPSIGPEQFHSFLIEKISEDARNILPQNRPRMFDEFLGNIFSSFPNKDAVGIDIKYYQYDWIPGMLQILKRNNVRIIHLRRRNALKHLISIYLHSKREILARKMHGTKDLDPVKVTFNKDVVKDLHSLNGKAESFSHAFYGRLKCLEFYYEDCMPDSTMSAETINRSVLDRLYDFLEINERRYDMKTKLRKTNPGTLQDLIPNYNDVIGFLSGTEWEYLLRV
jgi:hypothetical protein